MLNEDQIIEQLVLAREDVLLDSVVNEFLHPDNLKALTDFILAIARRKINSEIAVIIEQDKCFSKFIAILASKAQPISKTNIKKLISFASNLMQYTTLMSIIPTPIYSKGIIELNIFINSKADELGNCDLNTLVIEYKLVKIYNDVAKVIKNLNESKSPDIDLPRVIAILKLVDNQVAKLELTESDNIYTQYLKFMANYTVAKVYECLAIISVKNIERTKHLVKPEEVSEILASLSVSETALSVRQNGALKDAEKCLDAISAYGESVSAPGIEYTLGMDLLNKIPCNGIDSIKEHIRTIRAR